jgi:hypothetical protein
MTMPLLHAFGGSGSLDEILMLGLFGVVLVGLAILVCRSSRKRAPRNGPRQRDFDQE